MILTWDRGSNPELSFLEKKGEKNIYSYLFLLLSTTLSNIMEKRIELERRGKEPAQVKELNLDNARATQIEGLTDEYTNLETLSLINVGLTTLKGFPKLPKLKKLELSDNRISNGLGALKDCPLLTHLNLSNNKIKDLEAIEPVKSFDSLTHLDLFNNDICNSDEYRTKVFKLLPNLKYLDDADADDNDEAEEESDVDDVDEGEDGEPGGANGAEEEDDDDDDDDDEDGDDESDDGSDEEDGEDEGEMTLSDLYGKNLDDDEDGEDFVEGDGEEEDDDDDIDEEDEPSSKKPKVEEDKDA